jgi:hypothetical protein
MSSWTLSETPASALSQPEQVGYRVDPTARVCECVVDLVASPSVGAA